MRKDLLTLHFALQPYLQFGLLLWGHAYTKHLSRLEVVQRKAIRAIAGAKYNESASQSFKITGELKLSYMLQVSMLQYMYRFVNDDLRAPLLETFVYHRDVHTHASRHQNDIHVNIFFSLFLGDSTHVVGCRINSTVSPCFICLYDTVILLCTYVNVLNKIPTYLLLTQW